MIDTEEDETYYPESSDDPWFEEQRLLAEGRAAALLSELAARSSLAA